MSWRAITDDDIRSAITASEDTLYREQLLADGQTDPYAQITAQVTSLFRDAIRANSANTLDSDPATLPEGAIFHAVATIRQRLMTRFPAIAAPDETRAQEAKDARDYLRDVRKPGSPSVEAPGETQTKQSIPSPSVNESPRRDGWRSQDGI